MVRPLSLLAVLAGFASPLAAAAAQAAPTPSLAIVGGAGMSVAATPRTRWASDDQVRTPDSSRSQLAT